MDPETLALAKIPGKDDSEGTSRKGFMHADSGPIGGAYAAESMQSVHCSSPDGEDRSEELVGKKRKLGDLSAEHTAADLSSVPIKQHEAKVAKQRELGNMKVTFPAQSEATPPSKPALQLTPAIVSTIKAVHNEVVGHMGVARTMRRLQNQVQMGSLEQSQCPTRPQVAAAT